MDTWSKCLPVVKEVVCRMSGFPHWLSLLLMALRLGAFVGDKSLNIAFCWKIMPFFFSPLFHVSASVHFSFRNKQPQSMGCKELDTTNWLNDNNPTHIHLLQSKNEKEFWKLKWSFFTLKIFFFFFCYHLQRDLIHPKQAIAQTTIRWGFMG